MKNLTPTLTLLLINIISWGQTADEQFNKAMSAFQAKNYLVGVQLLDTLIQDHPDYENLSDAYFNRGSGKSFINDTIGAIADYTMAYELNPEYANAVRMRGYLREKTGSFVEALADYNLSISIDSNFGYAYLNKALLLEKQQQTTEACANFEIALDLGITDVAGIIKKSCDSNSVALQKYTYKILVDKSNDETYGYTLENPVKVGHGPRAQRAYLNLIRDAQGNPIEYKRLGNAGYYKSENGMFGMAAVDSYEVTYRNEKGKKKDATIYISFYDYDPPKIPVNLYSIQDFE